jgi:RND family efflux transporter MFP subunit
MMTRTNQRFLPTGVLLLRIAFASLSAGLVSTSGSFAAGAPSIGDAGARSGVPGVQSEGMQGVVPGTAGGTKAVPSSEATPASMVVQLREVDLGFPVEATVEAVRQATVAAQIAGRVIDIRVDAGQRVKQGELLMRLDAREAAGSDASAQASLAQASAAYERTRNLHAQKFVSQAALDQAAAAWKAAQGAAASSGAGLSHGLVTAPIAGLVAQRLIEPGEMAAPGRPLITVFDPKGLRVIANLPQYKLAELKKAGRARIEFPESGRWVDAVRVEILPTVDVRSHTATARLYLPENIEGVVPGIYARAHFIIGKAQKLTVPPTAVLRRGEVTAVYVLDDKGAVRLRQVRLGEAVAGGELEVLAGINAGERVSLVPLKTGIDLKTPVSR